MEHKYNTKKEVAIPCSHVSTYIEYINKYIGAPVKYVSNGLEREQIITISKIFICNDIVFYGIRLYVTLVQPKQCASETTEISQVHMF